MNLQRVLAGVTAAEAEHVYNALAQWADNERNGIEEMDENERNPAHLRAVEAVEAVVARMELEMIGEPGTVVELEPWSAAELRSLVNLPSGSELREDREAPQPFAVWLDDDIIGAGATAREAIEDAHATVREWEAAK